MRKLVDAPKDQLLYSIEEMAEILRIEPKTLRNRMSQGVDHPPFIRVGKPTYFPAKQFESWIKDRKVYYPRHG